MSVLETKDNSDSQQGPSGTQPLLGQAPAAQSAQTASKIDVPMFGAGYGIYERRPENFVLSFLTHALAVALLVWITQLTFGHIKPVTTSTVTPLVGPYLPMTQSRKAGGGGGGGENSKIQASMGGPPKMSKEQLAPPVVLRPKEESKIMVEPTVVADLKLPQAPQIGDQLSKLMTPSSGTGVGSGVGTGSGGGYGSGHGRGYGPGNGYGSGGGDGGFGGFASPPKILYQPDPEFSEEARKAKYQGVVVLHVVVGIDGRVHNATVARSLGMGLDEKALESIRLWRFEPAKTRDGKAVDAPASIEVNFRLY